MAGAETPGGEAGVERERSWGTVAQGCWSDILVAPGCLKPERQGEVRARDENRRLL